MDEISKSELETAVHLLGLTLDDQIDTIIKFKYHITKDAIRTKIIKAFVNHYGFVAGDIRVKNE